jgi:hypothetical protein
MNWLRQWRIRQRERKLWAALMLLSSMNDEWRDIPACSDNECECLHDCD